MDKFKSFIWAFSILIFLVSGTGADLKDAIESSEVSLEKLYKQEPLSGGNHIDSFAVTDRDYSGPLLLPETENGRIFHQVVSFTSPLIGYCGLLFSETSIVRRSALIIPGLNSRTLIFPFHSFF